MKTFFTITEAAQICSVNRSTMHRWVAAGKIKSYSTPGGRKRIQKTDLKEFLAESQMPIDVDGFGDSKKKVLVVDDDPAIQDYITKVLSGPFIEIAVASDGFEAGVKLIEFNPDLVILDLIMPGQDGFQVCRAIKENPSTRRIKVLIMTGHGNQENRDKVFAIGADGFLQKPARMKEIVKEVERLLQ